MADNNAGWWDAPQKNNAGDSSVIRHAPDANNYHVPDSVMLREMRGSAVGNFAVIPEANYDGTSKGFDSNKAGLVHVDPNSPDGGVIFDANAVSQQQLHAALANSAYPHQVYYQLGTPARLRGRGDSQPTSEAPRINQHMPNTYVVPQSAGDGSQQSPVAEENNLHYPAPEEPAMKVTPSLTQPNQPVPYLAPLPMQYPVAQYSAAPPPMQYTAAPLMPYQQQPDPQMMSMLAQMNGAIAALQQQLAAQNVALAQTTGISRVPMPSARHSSLPAGLATLPVGMNPQVGVTPTVMTSPKNQPVRSASVCIVTSKVRK